MSPTQPSTQSRPYLILPFPNLDLSLAVPLPYLDPFSLFGPTSPSFSPTLSDLERLHRIGSGSAGTVWLVRHRFTGQTYALKVIYACYDDAVCYQIRREIEILRTANNNSVVRCHGMYDCAGEIQILFEYMDGGSLRGRQITSEPVLADVARQILTGLAYLHSRKIVHGDIKPSNLLINGDLQQVKIADFGVRRILEQSTDPYNSSIKETIAYMSPERINTDLNHGGIYDGYAGDIWSFGLSALEFYLGWYPFGDQFGNWQQGDLGNLMRIICYSDPPVAPPEASSEFRSFVTCCLQKEPCRRLTAAQLLHHPFIAQLQLSPP